MAYVHYVVLLALPVVASAQNCSECGAGGGAKERSAHAREVLPDTIALPRGLQPESVVKGRGAQAFVGSLKTGGIYELDMRSGRGSLLVNSAPGPAVGLACDRRSNSHTTV